MTSTGRQFIVASLPAALIGVYELAAGIRAQAVSGAEFWQLEALVGLGIATESAGALTAVAVGAAFWLPLLAVSLLVSRGVAGAFARWRSLPLDPDWALAAWLYALLLPATLPLGYAALGLAFGLVFGCHVFGGSARSLVNPALLGVVFLTFAYPPLFAAGAALPVAFGGTVALASLLGAAYLIVVRAITLSIVAGGIASFAALGLLTGALSLGWPLAVGNFVFVLAFVATDPGTRPRSMAGGWAFGALFGLLTIILQSGNSVYPDSSLAALLLACLAVPLLDHLVRFSRTAEQGTLDA